MTVRIPARYIAITTTEGRVLRVPVPNHLTDAEVHSRVEALGLEDLDGVEVTKEGVETLGARIWRAFYEPN